MDQKLAILTGQAWYLKPVLLSDNTISVSGGTNKIKAYASFGYLNNKGTSIGQKFTRYSGKASVDIQATDWFNMGLTANVTYGIQEFGQSNSTLVHLLALLKQYLQFCTGHFSNGPFLMIQPVTESFIPAVMWPLKQWWMKRNIHKTKEQPCVHLEALNAQLDFGKIHPALKGLKYRFNFGPDFSNYSNGIYIDGKSAASSGINGASLQEAKTYSWTLDN